MSLFFIGGEAQFVLFCSVYPFYLSSFVFSFRVFCPRGLSVLRAASFSGSPARVHVVWDSFLWFICWCHPFGRGCFGITATRFICNGLGGVCILPTRLGFRLPPVWPAAYYCACVEGSRLSAVIGLCRSLWRPLAAAAE